MTNFRIFETLKLQIEVKKGKDMSIIYGFAKKSDRSLDIFIVESLDPQWSKNKIFFDQSSCVQFEKSLKHNTTKPPYYGIKSIFF